ncbi:phage head morphogenesis protein [Phytobacter ursingii]|uniref:Phage minor head protein n=1 Tax=Phytobacter ursingii TaxID=1972431 RepID=A0AB35RP70_9ENTR|nr:phage minor head protein [Phytobacter ursingii]MDV2861842.1 phage minor head protein [Phytobacter ursingii]
MMKIKTLRRVRYSNELAGQYASSLKSLITRMVDSTNYWATAQYNASIQCNRGALDVAERIQEIREKWVLEFSESAVRIAPAFAQAADNFSTRALKGSLTAAEIPRVKFTMTPQMEEAINEIVAENVSLIKSIPERYFTQVETITMESIRRGRDLQYMTEELQKQYGITRRRAENIALDQNNKACSQLARVRQKSLGITRGIWIHSGGGSHPRPLHVKAHGQEFDLDEGLPIGDNGEYVLPGEEIHCGCSWKPVLPF